MVRESISTIFESIPTICRRNVSICVGNTKNNRNENVNRTDGYLRFNRRAFNVALKREVKGP